MSVAISVVVVAKIRNKHTLITWLRRTRLQIDELGKTRSLSLTRLGVREWLFDVVTEGPPTKDAHISCTSDGGR